jgi:hypothetical protein
MQREEKIHRADPRYERQAFVRPARLTCEGGMNVARGHCCPGRSCLAWSWNADFGCSSDPGLITDYNGDPAAYRAAY